MPAHGLPAQALTIAGSGSAKFERDGQLRPFSLATEDLLGAVNALYRIRFFDLPANLGASRSVFLKDDGSLGTQVLSMHDATTSTVCFSVAGFEKCVVYRAPPSELADLVQHLLYVARQRTEASAPPN